MGKLSEHLFGVELTKQLNPKYRFEEFWAAYPKRRGGSPKTLTERKYIRAINDGADHEHIVSSAKKYKDELIAQRKIETEFVCMASTWLNQKRWIDYAPDPENKEREARRDADMSARGYTWNGERWLKVSPTSMKAIDEACNIYNSALESLAKK